MKNWQILSVLVASLAMPGMTLAAIDDQGMAYVSASEGLSGRIQMRWNHASRKKLSDPFYRQLFADPNFARSPQLLYDDVIDKGSVKLDTLRLYLSGDLDIGSGMKSTYYTEIRNDGNEGLKLHAYDIGITGAFGSVNFGRLDGVTERMIPSGSLDTVAGSVAEAPYAHPDSTRMRYESPSIYGLKVGFSTSFDDDRFLDPFGAPDGAYEGYDAAVHYSHPIGVTAGFGVQYLKDGGLEAFTTSDSVAVRRKELKGYLTGLRWAHDKLTVGYEYRIFANFQGIVQYPSAPLLITDFREKYRVHRFGVRYQVLDRVTASSNYSREVQEPSYSGHRTYLGESVRTTFGADVAYTLGSKSRVALGYLQQELNENVDLNRYRSGIGDPTALLPEGNSSRLDTIILDYQVNF